MTTRLATRLSDTTLPGPTARQVWHAPDLRSHALAVLTAARLYLVPADAVLVPGTFAELRAGVDVDAALGPAATVIDLAAVRRLELALARDTLTVETAAGPVEVRFGSAEAADAGFTAVWKRLGDGCELVPYKQDGWAAARRPLAAMAGVAAGTFVLGLGLFVVTDTLGPLPDWLDGLANWRAVCGFGGGVMAVLQVWLYRRLTVPPDRLEVVRRPAAGGSV
jgi:hypothetical protein